jgi:glycosyltransferase involved in cell wall biosynthesis
VPTVSVIIPTHNRSALLRRALESVRAQTRLPDEVIVVDDGSTDDTATWVPGDYADVVFLRRKNSGVSAARNAGIAAARGRWIAFLDSDDEWRPRKLERQLRALSASPDTPLCHTDEIWIRNGRRVNRMHKHAKHGGWIYPRCLPLCAISPSSAIVRRDVFDDVGLFDEDLPACEDYDMWLRVCSRYPVLLVDEPLVVKYGGHDDQLSRRYWGMDRFRIRALDAILRAGVLGEGDRRATVETLCEKLDIYIAGARKRRRREEVEAYESMRRRWAAA